MRRFLVAVACALLAPASAAAGLAVGSASGRDGWVVEVSLEARGPGPVELSLHPLRPAPLTDSHAWLQHELVITNASRRQITFADTRTARLLGGRLLVAEEGCGYGLRPLEPACLLYLDIPALDGGESLSRTFTLWKGLRGLEPMAPGTYVFSKVLRFDFGRAAPGLREGRRAIVRLIYRVQA
jgi:hypothetical protein